MFTVLNCYRKWMLFMGMGGIWSSWWGVLLYDNIWLFCVIYSFKISVFFFFFCFVMFINLKLLYVFNFEPFHVLCWIYRLFVYSCTCVLCWVCVLQDPRYHLQQHLLPIWNLLSITNPTILISTTTLSTQLISFSLYLYSWKLQHCSLFLQGSPLHVNAEVYVTHTHATCLSSNLIYLLTYTQCDAFYVGETKKGVH